VGDFNRALPTKAEYEALEELIRYLRQRVGKVDAKYSIVRGHNEINPRPTDCPGNRFPLNRLHRSFPDWRTLLNREFAHSDQSGFNEDIKSDFKSLKN
jgi:N-acetyl-anhydromuramyl-L-alanine amidase AmpD